MSERYLLNADGTTEAEPDLLKWAKGFETQERQIALTEFPDGVRVSTVFLGLDYSLGSGPPLLFETMVFGGPLDSEQDRYSTKAESQAGHDAMVEKVKSAARQAGSSV